MRIEFECSETLMQLLEAARGGDTGIPLDQHIVNVLTIGSGHMLEEILSQQRNAIYQEMLLRTNSFANARSLLQPSASPMPKPRDFGGQITRPRVVR